MNDFLSGVSVQDWIAFGSALVAITSLAFNLRLVNRQERREIEALRLQKDADLIAWADDAIVVLGDIQGLLRDRARLIDRDEFARHRSRLRTAVFVTMDRGRLFFPGNGDVSESEESAYDGSDDQVIAALADAGNLLKSIDPEDHDYSRDDVLALVAIRRQFVSRVFDAVDPRRRAQVFSSLN